MKFWALTTGFMGRISRKKNNLFFNLRPILQNGILCMLVASLFFAIMGALIKFAITTVSVSEAVFFRSIISVALLIFLMMKRGDSFRGNRPMLLVWRGFSGFVALNLNFYAVSKIPLGDASILNQTSPLFVTFFSILFLKETLSREVLFLSVLSLVGVAFIVKPNFSFLNLPAMAGLASGIMAAFAYIAIRELHATDSFLTMALYFSAISTLLSFPPLLFHFTFPPLPIFLALVGAGIAGTIAQLLMTYAYKNEAASVVSPFSYAGVIFSFLFGMCFFGEIPDGYTALGALIVVASCAWLTRVRNRRPLGTPPFDPEI